MYYFGMMEISQNVISLKKKMVSLSLQKIISPFRCDCPVCQKWQKLQGDVVDYINIFIRMKSLSYEQFWGYSND
jgi:hypothetical protein